MVPDRSIELERWTERDLDGMSWHDNHVHSLQLVEGEHGAGELVLDLDYIVDWLQDSGGFRFRIVPVHLRFKQVTNLRLTLDYAGSSAAMGPFSIDHMALRTEQRERYTAQCWEIVLNWPRGEISFEATGFEQTAWGKAQVSDRQVLMVEERLRA